MHRLRTSLIAAFAFCVFFGASDAWSQNCIAVCNSSVSCDTGCYACPYLDQACADPPWSTCGAEGLACLDPACEWQTTRYEIGRHQSGLPPYFCTYWVSYRYVSTSACYGTREWCDDEWDGGGVNMNCCDAWGCWGASC